MIDYKAVFYDFTSCSLVYIKHSSYHYMVTFHIDFLKLFKMSLLHDPRPHDQWPMTNERFIYKTCKRFIWYLSEKFPLAPMGVLPPGSAQCACSTLCSAPHRHQRKFVGARVCKVAFQHVPQPIRSHIQQLLKIPPLSTQNLHSAGGRGVPDFFFDWNLNIFVSFEPMQNFITLG